MQLETFYQYIFREAHCFYHKAKPRADFEHVLFPFYYLFLMESCSFVLMQRVSELQNAEVKTSISCIPRRTLIVLRQVSVIRDINKLKTLVLRIQLI